MSAQTRAKSFIYFFGVTFVGSLSALLLSIYVIDPYDLWNSPLNLHRVPVSSDHRLVYSSLAVQPKFDLAIIGSSTLRNINPKSIESQTGKKVVSLAMNSATLSEQHFLTQTFLSNAKRTGVVIGVDLGWCRKRPLNRRTPTGVMPLWIRDRYNFNASLQLLSAQTINDSLRLIQFWLGHRKPKYTVNGYRSFEEDLGPYDREAAAQRIKSSIPKKEQSGPEGDLIFPSSKIVDSFSQSTRMVKVVLVFVPIHSSYYGKIKQQMEECKESVLQGFSHNEELVILDYMKSSLLTKDLANFWDVHHLTEPPTRLIEQDISHALLKQQPPSVERLVIRSINGKK